MIYPKHPPRNQNVYKHTLSNAHSKILQLQLSPGLVASYDFQPGDVVGVFWDAHVPTFLLTCFRTNTGHTAHSVSCCVVMPWHAMSLLSAELVAQLCVALWAVHKIVRRPV